MASVQDKILFLKEIRENPGKYLPIADHAWKVFPKVNEGTEWYDDPQTNIGWDAGLLEGNRPYFAECWATCGITMLTYFVSASGMENAETAELIQKLENAKLLKIRNPKDPRTTAVEFEDDNGNKFYSINITVGDEDGTYIDGGRIYPFAELNKFNKGKT